MRRLLIGFGAVAVWMMLGAAHSPPSAAGPAAITDDGGAIQVGKIGKSCTFKGKKLWGKVQVVNSFPDIKVQVVNSFPDLKVKKVTSFPDKCGKWQFVKSFPDIKIQFVKSFPDVKIKYVDSFPGVP